MLDTATSTHSTSTTTTFAEPFSAPVPSPPMTLSEAINAAHDAAKGAGRTMLLKAKEAGDLLLQAKSECAHGAFKAWIEENCAFSYSTAKAYMQASKRTGACPFDDGTTLEAFLAATATPRSKMEEEAASSATGAAKVSELKAEIARLAGAVERLSGELQEARGRETALRDALATAEAHIKTLQEASGGPVVSLDDACGLHDAPPASPFITAEELATLRQEVADLNEMLNDADKAKAELREEVKDLHRKLKLATDASPKAALALRPKDLDENGLDMNDARNW